MSELTGPGKALADAVSPKTADALRTAMTRLLTGTPQHTDGQLTKENLYREAGVSRATMNRAAAVLAAWDTALAARRTTEPTTRRDTENEDLRRRLSAKNRQCTELIRRLDAAATAITALHHDNTALRDQLERDEGSNVITLRRSTTAPPE